MFPSHADFAMIPCLDYGVETFCGSGIRVPAGQIEKIRVFLPRKKVGIGSEIEAEAWLGPLL